jgi:hypothetical protein
MLAAGSERRHSFLSHFVAFRPHVCNRFVTSCCRFVTFCHTGPGTGMGILTPASGPFESGRLKSRQQRCKVRLCGLGQRPFGTAAAGFPVLPLRLRDMAARPEDWLRLCRATEGSFPMNLACEEAESGIAREQVFWTGPRRRQVVSGFRKMGREAGGLRANRDIVETSVEGDPCAGASLRSEEYAGRMPALPSALPVGDARTAEWLILDLTLFLSVWTSGGGLP